MFAQPLKNGLTTRAIEGLNFIPWLGEYVEALNKDKIVIEAIVHCGDMFTQKSGISTALYNTTLDALRHLTDLTGLNFYYLPGNHDILMKTDARMHNMYAIIQALPDAYEIDDRGVWIIEDQVEIFGVKPPFVERKLHARPSHVVRRILIVHENIIGGRYESGKLIDKGVSQSALRSYAQANDIDFIFGGDIHEPQKIKGKPPICLIGAPLQFSFGDKPNRGFWLYEPKANLTKFVRYPEGPKYTTITDADIDKYTSIAFGPGEYVRFQVSASANLVAAREIAGKNRNVRVEYLPSKAKEESAQIIASRAAFTTPEKLLEPYVEMFAEKYTKKERAELVKLGRDLMVTK